MKQRLIQLCVILTLAAFAIVQPAIAGSHSRPSSAPKKSEAHVTVITAITPSSITIQEDKVTKSFAITPFTEVNLNGQRASLADLKSGMSVTVTLGSDPSKLSRIDAGPAPVPK